MRGSGSGAIRHAVISSTAAVAAVLAACVAGTQPARADRPLIYAITGATIQTAPGKVIQNGTVVLRDGLIAAVGADAAVPADAVKIDATGKTVHAGFIDACAEIGMRDVPSVPAPGGGKEDREAAGAGSAHPVSAIRPERRLYESLTLSDSEREKHRGLGFTTAHVLPVGGIFRGTSTLVNLGARSIADNVLLPDAAQVIGFDHTEFNREYPTSLMGAIAAVRQGFEDARRHEEWQRRWQDDPRGLRRPDMSAAWGPLADAADGRMPVLFDAQTALRGQQSLAIAKEFGLDPWLIGSGYELEVLEDIRAAHPRLILPIAFPDKPDVSDAVEIANVETRSLERYFTAADNPAKVAGAGLEFAIGTCRARSVSDFKANIKRAIASGLSADKALAALTTVPASFFGLERSLGTIEAGKSANLVIESGPLFGESTVPERVFVDGREYKIKEKPKKGDPNATADPLGTWKVTWTVGSETAERTWVISGTPGSLRGTAETRAGVVTLRSATLVGNALTVVIPGREGSSELEVTVVISGDTFAGDGEFFEGKLFRLKGTRTEKPKGDRL